MDRIGIMHILPAVIVVAAICVGVRVNGMVNDRPAVAENTFSESFLSSQLSALETAAGEAPEPSQDALKDPAQSAPANENANQAAGQDAAPPAQADAPALENPTSNGDWRGAEDLDDEYSDVKLEMFEDLSKRRKELEEKEKELLVREALLKTAQAELEQKYTELTAVKGDIEELLKKQSNAEDERITSLVKIYEGMKPKDAARIFDNLDMDVLMQVVSRMSERKSAPIIAAMNEDKARNVTILMAEQNKLPSLPRLPSN